MSSAKLWKASVKYKNGNVKPWNQNVKGGNDFAKYFYRNEKY